MILEPGQVFAIEMGSELLADHLVVVIEPLLLLGGEEGTIDGRKVYRTERQRLHLQEAAQFGLHIILDQARVFDAHTKAVGQIDARLVGDGHSRTQGSRHILHAHLVGPLMDIEIGTHTVARAVEVVEPRAP